MEVGGCGLWVADPGAKEKPYCRCGQPDRSYRQHRRHQIQPPGRIPPWEADERLPQQQVGGEPWGMGDAATRHGRHQVAAVGSVVGPGEGGGQRQHVHNQQEGNHSHFSQWPLPRCLGPVAIR